MRKPISIVLAGLLVVLPLQQVQAQVAHQEAVSVQQTVPPEGAAHLFRVPPLTENTARVLWTRSDRTVLNTPFAGALLVQEDPSIGWKTDDAASMVANNVSRVEARPLPRLNTAGKVALTVLVLAVVLVAAVIIDCHARPGLTTC